MKTDFLKKVLELVKWEGLLMDQMDGHMAGSLIDIRHRFRSGASTAVKVLVWTVLIKDVQVGPFTLKIKSQTFCQLLEATTQRYRKKAAAFKDVI